MVCGTEGRITKGQRRAKREGKQRKVNLMLQLFSKVFFITCPANTSHSNFMFTKTTISFNESFLSQFFQSCLQGTDYIYKYNS